MAVLEHLYAWLDAVFPNSKIYGEDIDRRILFTDGRIQTFYCDQINPTEISRA